MTLHSSNPDRAHASTFSFAATSLGFLRRDAWSHFKTIPASTSTIAALLCREAPEKEKTPKLSVCCRASRWFQFRMSPHQTETVFSASLERTGRSFTACTAARYGKIINCVALTQSTDKHTLSVHPADILQYKSLLQEPHPLSRDPDPS